MSHLDRLLPTPRLLELDHVDLAAPPERVWPLVRHGDLARSRLIKALFAVRTLPSRFGGTPPGPPTLRIDDLVSSEARPGFRVLIDEPPNEVVVGAIGKVWQPDIPFVHSESPAAFAAFARPDFAKVAWAVRVLPRGTGSRVEVEVRVDATDETAWRAFHRYFVLVGIGSRLIRRDALASLARELGDPDAVENERQLEGDDLLPDASVQDTRWIDVAASPQGIWPWLVQMGCGRAGYYSIDVLDNGGTRSARELHPELQAISVGDVLPATPQGRDGFEVLRIIPGRSLVLGGLFDPEAGRQLPFAAPRPKAYWHVTWSFVLEPLDERTTRLHARARVAFTPDQRLHLAWIRPVHALMETAQLRGLAARAERRMARDDWRDVVEGLGGAAVIMAAFFTSFLRGPRSHWGLSAEAADRAFPGDELVATPRWGWTHGIEIDAPAAVVWPWIAQIGAGRGGFYSYQWLENLAGCALSNAERVHPEWQLREGDLLSLHPRGPSLRVRQVVPERFLLAHDARPRVEGEPWAEVTWLFLLEPLGTDRCRLISRTRYASSDDLASRLTVGPTLLEPIGFAMDRRMLQGVKERAEPRPEP